MNTARPIAPYADRSAEMATCVTTYFEGIGDESVEHVELESIQKYWDERSDTYFISVADELDSDIADAWDALFAEHMDFGSASLRVLDVGTGPGFFARLFAQRGCEVEAIDCSSDMIDKARTTTQGFENAVTLSVMDATALDFVDDSFDVVVTRNLTWTLPDPEAAYAEWMRVLKPGGILLNCDANWYNYLKDERINRERLKNQADETVLTNLDACASDEQCSACELIALEMPLTGIARPAWDVAALKRVGFSDIQCDESVWERVWDAGEKRFYATSPLFMIAATK